MTYPSDAWELLSPRLTDHRRQRMLSVAHQRTKHIRLVVQDIHDPHNVSACMRSADAFGIQNVDIVTLKEPFRASTVARGVNGWLHVNRFDSVAKCAENLRQKGFKIVAGVPTDDAVSLYDLPLDQPIAAVFGNEHAGIDSQWLEEVDQCFTIPMSGMVESLNISVSAAVTMAHLTHGAKEKLGPSYFLSSEEQTDLLNEWVCRTIHSHQAEIARLRASKT